MPNIKMDKTEIGCEGLEWIKFIHDTVQLQAFVNTAMNLLQLSNCQLFKEDPVGYHGVSGTDYVPETRHCIQIATIMQ